MARAAVFFTATVRPALVISTPCLAARSPSVFWTLLLLASQALAQCAFHQEFLWVVTNRHSTVYLLGSIHALRPADYPLAEIINRAFVQAEQVVFEIKYEEFNSPLNLSYLSAKANYPGNETIQQHLAAGTYQLLKNYQSETGLTLSERFRPWYVHAIISGEETKRLGYTESSGVDRYFYDRAKAEAKPILALETASFQIDLLAEAPLDQQESELREILADRDAFKIGLEKIVGAWKSGHVANLTATIEEGRNENPEYHKKFFVDRNQNWIPKIEGFLDQSKVTLVVVGAGHLVGRDGVVNLLRSRGHAVTQLPVLPTRLLTTKHTLGGNTELSFEVITGHNYSLEGSPDLLGWSPIHRFGSADTTTNFTDSSAQAYAQRFYRLRNLDAEPSPP